LSERPGTPRDGTDERSLMKELSLSEPIEIPRGAARTAALSGFDRHRNRSTLYARAVFVISFFVLGTALGYWLSALSTMPRSITPQNPPPSQWTNPVGTRFLYSTIYVSDCDGHVWISRNSEQSPTQGGAGHASINRYWVEREYGFTSYPRRLDREPRRQPAKLLHIYFLSRLERKTW
jgi:hypothetical protein